MVNIKHCAHAQSWNSKRSTSDAVHIYCKKNKLRLKLSMTAHAYNPSIWKLRQGVGDCCKFEANLGYMVKFNLELLRDTLCLQFPLALMAAAVLGLTPWKVKNSDGTQWWLRGSGAE